MAIEDDISPMVKSMRVFGLFPSNSLAATEKPTKLKWVLMHVYSAALIMICWLNAIRYLTLFYYVPQKQLADILYALMVVSYYTLCAILRTVFTSANWNGKDGWFKILAYANDAEFHHEFSDKSASCFLSGFDKLDKAHRKGHKKQLRTLHILCWLYVILQFTFITGSSLLARDVHGPTLTPFHVLLKDNNVGYTIIAFVAGFLTAASDSTASFTNAFISCLTLEFAHKLNLLGQIANCTLTDETESWRHSEDVEDADTNEKQSNPSEAKSCQIENMRCAHLYIMNCVKKLDYIARPCIAASMSFGFFGALVNMYKLIWGTPSVVLRLTWAFFLIICLKLLLSHLLTSAYLNSRAMALYDSIFHMSPVLLLGSAHRTNSCPFETAQLGIFLAQIFTEPIALTYAGILPLLKETIMQLFGTVFIYFLIVVDYTAGEKRGILDGGSTSEDSGSPLMSASTTAMFWNNTTY